VNVAGELIQLGDHQPGAGAPALIDGTGESRVGIVLAALVFVERADELPVAPR
jgi:hypothetical protein